MAELEKALEGISVASYKLEASRRSEEFSIKGFPQIFFWSKGDMLKYEDERTEEKLKVWVSRKVSPEILHYTEEKTQLRVNEELCSKHEYCIIAQGIDEEVLKDISRRVDLPVYALQGNESLVFYKDYANSPYPYNYTITPQDVGEFVNFHITPALLPLETKYMDSLFNKGGSALILLRDRRHRNYDSALTSIGDELKGKLYLIIADVSQHIGRQIQLLLKVPDKSLPCVRIVVSKGGSLNITQYHMSDEVYYENIINFVSRWENGFVNPYVLTQDVPQKLSENRVLTIVGQTFDKIVYEEGRDILVIFYAPWCSYSKGLLPIIEQLAYEYRNYKNFAIGKIDGYYNYIDSSIRGFPTIRLYQASTKSYIQFQADRTLTLLRFFINSHITPIYKEDL